MTEGVSTFEGLAVPLLGESEIKQQTAATDILSITGAASQTGDFLVLQNSSGAELLVVSASGALTLLTAGMTFAGLVENTLSSTTQSSGFNVSVTSTGAIAAGGILGNAFLVSASSKSVLNNILAYNSGPGSEVGSANAFLAVYGSKAPSYLLSVGATVAGVGAATDNGLFEAATRFLTAPSTAITYGAVKMLAGSKVYYILAIPDTSMVDT